MQKFVMESWSMQQGGEKIVQNKAAISIRKFEGIVLVSVTDECCPCSIVLHSTITRVTLTTLKLNASNNGISILILRKFLHTKMHVNCLIF